MKKILFLPVVLLLLASCNSGRYYANYRVGGKSEKIKYVATDTFTVNKQEKWLVNATLPDSLALKSCDSPTITHPPMVAEKKEECTTDNPQPVVVSSAPETKKSLSFQQKKEFLPSVSRLSQTVHRSPAATLKKNAFQSVDHGERVAILFWTFIGIILIGGLITALIAIPNFWAIFLGALGVVAAALLLGAIMAAILDFIMPGDSMFSKKKNPLITFLKKCSLAHLFPSKKTKYYGGMSVKSYFWIGMGVWVLLLVGMAVFGASDVAWAILLGLLGAHLVISAFAALIVGFVSLFPGMKK